MMKRLRDLFRGQTYDAEQDETVLGLNKAAASENARAEEIRRQRRQRDYLTARLLPLPESRGEEGRHGENR